jgi:hypothetical protein
MSGGTFLRGEDGSLYFVRDEVLEACKVEGEHLDYANQMLDADGDAEVEGFAFNVSGAPQLQPIRYVDSPNIGMQPNGALMRPDIGAVSSTVMCPW